VSGIDWLAASMLIAAVVVTPLAGDAAVRAGRPVALAAGISRGVVVRDPLRDRLAGACGLPRATYALMVALLPAIATVIGVVVLAQIPTGWEVAGVGLVIAGVALHGPSAL
jgi:inner membrane transporter RhtA